VAEVTFGVRASNSGPLRDASVSHLLSADEALADVQSADFFESLTTTGYLASKTSNVRIGVAYRS